MARRDFRPIFDAIGDGNSDTVFLGDFNAHNVAWNCPSTDTKGDLLHELMDDEGLICVNTDTCSRNGARGQRDTNLDLLFGSNHIVGEISYHQLADAWGSDHFPISFSFDNHPMIYKKITNRLSTKKTDWRRFGELVKSRVTSSLIPSRELLEEDFEAYYSSFIDIIKDAVAVALGRRAGAAPTVITPDKRKQSHRWWDAECEEVIHDRKTSLAAFKKSKSLHDWLLYRRAAAVARRTIKLKKKASFEKFCSEIDRFTSLSYVWKTMRIMKNARKNLE
ncbi:uncharacterized protein [Temnothorax nylanderi]|uniref:uncharacterized protein n=1 Tax=Temnothorax nylanderi TaxID=102681 RepID=UPI003A8A82DB